MRTPAWTDDFSEKDNLMRMGELEQELINSVTVALTKYPIAEVLCLFPSTRGRVQENMLARVFNDMIDKENESKNADDGDDMVEDEDMVGWTIEDGAYDDVSSDEDMTDAGSGDEDEQDQVRL